MKKIFTIVLIGLSLHGMHRPNAMGLPSEVCRNNLIWPCTNYCTSECCPIATLAAGAEIFNGACVVNPTISDLCDVDNSRRILKVGIGLALFVVVGAGNYIMKTKKHIPERKKECILKTCGICWGSDRAINSLLCHPKHQFHIECIAEWEKIHKGCPLCGAEVVINHFKVE